MKTEEEIKQSRRDATRRWAARNPEYRRQWRRKNRKKESGYALSWAAKNMERVKENGKNWRARNPEKVKEYEKARNPAKAAASHLKRKYGLAVADIEKLVLHQGDRCAICVEPFLLPRDRHVDHNHTTGKIRGLLCRNCNLSLGLLKDSSKLLLAAAAYLKSNE